MGTEHHIQGRRVSCTTPGAAKLFYVNLAPTRPPNEWCPVSNHQRTPASRGVELGE